MSKNFTIFGVDMSSSVHIDNNKKYILIPGIGLTQRIDDITLAAEVQLILRDQIEILFRPALWWEQQYSIC